MTDYKEFIQHFMDKAAESVASAREQLRDGHAEFAASRAYYAMFYAAEATLLSKNLQFKKHSAVISSFKCVWCPRFFKNGACGPVEKGAVQEKFLGTGNVFLRKTTQSPNFSTLLST